MLSAKTIGQVNDPQLLLGSKGKNNLFELNRQKFYQIFKKHSWKNIDGNKIVTYKEFVKILKLLDIFPRFISNYQLKSILVALSESPGSNSTYKTVEVEPRSTFGHKKSIPKESVPEYVGFKALEIIVCKYIKKCIHSMNVGAQENYGISLFTKKTKVFHHSRSQMKLRVEPQYLKYIYESRKRVMVDRKESLKREHLQGSKLNLEIPTANTFSFCENKDIDQSKQVVMKAGSLKLKKNNTEKPKKKTETTDKILGTNYSTKFMKQHSAKTPQARTKNLKIAPSVVPDVNKDSWFSTPKKSDTSEENSSTLIISCSSGMQKSRKKSLKDLLSGKIKFKRHSKYFTKGESSISKTSTSYCQDATEISSYKSPDQNNSVLCKNSLGVIEEEIRSFQPYWKISQSKGRKKEKRRNNDPHKENNNKTSDVKKECRGIISNSKAHHKSQGPSLSMSTTLGPKQRELMNALLFLRKNTSK
ncbi:unnamed protein product [Moneuplotes crassus]|uniref:Uncharacterized protein n=1 Tax=Euplotes crassus TaxID=5936 RepID=A0AAD1UFD0_EUPCR|nr:unnamed protein product [Moneuplotes crassus]